MSTLGRHNTSELIDQINKILQASGIDDIGMIGLEPIVRTIWYEDLDYLRTYIETHGGLFSEKNQEAPSETETPKWKNYQTLEYDASFEEVRCDMLIRRLEATKKLLKAQSEYFYTMSEIERENEQFGFDLDN